MNLRKRWLWETLKDVPGINQDILRSVLLSRPEIGRTDDVVREMHWPRIKRQPIACVPAGYPGVLIHRI